jgi:nucleoside phosphorylase
VTVAVVFALAAEFAPWRRLRRFHSIAGVRPRAYEAQVGVTRVRVLLSGIGAPHARVLTDTIRTDRAAFVVVAGVAGALKPEYETGQIVVARRVLSAEAGAVVSADERLVSLAGTHGATIVESFVSFDRIVARAEEKRRLGNHYDAVDMESFAVLSQAHANQLPGITIRVVGDTVEQDLPIDFTRAMRRDHTISVSRLLLEAARHPLQWPALVPYGISHRRSLAQLAAFLDRFIAGID